MRHEAGVKIGRISISQSSPQVSNVCVVVVVLVLVLVVLITQKAH